MGDKCILKWSTVKMDSIHVHPLGTYSPYFQTLMAKISFVGMKKCSSLKPHVLFLHSIIFLTEIKFDSIIRLR